MTTATKYYYIIVDGVRREWFYLSRERAEDVANELNGVVVTA